MVRLPGELSTWRFVSSIVGGIATGIVSAIALLCFIDQEKVPSDMERASAVISDEMRHISQAILDEPSSATPDLDAEGKAYNLHVNLGIVNKLNYIDEDTATHAKQPEQPEPVNRSH